MRWNPNGDLLAAVSEDKWVKLLDFKTGKVLYSQLTTDFSKWSLVVNIQYLDIRRRHIGQLHLKQGWTV